MDTAQKELIINIRSNFPQCGKTAVANIILRALREAGLCQPISIECKNNDFSYFTDLRNIKLAVDKMNSESVHITISDMNQNIPPPTEEHY